MYSNRSLLRRQRQDASSTAETSASRSEDRFSSSLIRLKGQSHNETSGNNTTSKNVHSVVIVIMEGRGGAEGRIGVAMHDVRYPEVNLCEFVDSREFTTLKTMINVHEAYDIVIQSGNEERGTTKLLGEALMTAFPEASLQSISAKYFNSDRGERQLRSLMNLEISTVSEGCFRRTLALGALAVLLKYIHETRFVFFRIKSLRIREMGVDDTCMIDFVSWESLEIVDTDDASKARKHQMKQKRTLMSVLNHTVTTNGYRLLRSNVLQPSTDVVTIESRQEAIEELIAQPQLKEKLRRTLSRAHELDRVIAMCIQTSSSWTVRESEAKINQIIKLMQTLKVIQGIRTLLDSANVKSQLLIEKTEDTRFEQIMQILMEKVDDSMLDGRKNSLHLQNTKCYAIRDFVAVQLDLARQTYEELVSQVEQTGAREIAEHFHNNPAVRLSFSQQRGFHYTLVTRQAESVTIPRNFMEVFRNRNTVTFNSRSVIAYNDRLEQVVSEMFLASDVIVCDMIELMQPVIPVLYYAMDALSTIDFLCGLATYSDLRDTCRPAFGQSFSVSQGRHPILDWADTEKTITNDILTSTSTSNGAFFQLKMLHLQRRLHHQVPAAAPHGNSARRRPSAPIDWSNLGAAANRQLDNCYSRSIDVIVSQFRPAQPCLTRDRRFGIITGPNMAGKSTYIKQAAQLAIIAQIGCFIPANYATMPIFTRIFSRMGHNDELVRNKSAFACEMSDAASIVQYADRNSLVVLDELARSTSAEEGVAITYAICERILSLQSYTFLATHFLDIAALANFSHAIEKYGVFQD
uniref:DNA_MISMATCH_REPAIR_2 domain-containing protein n=1 Tax=Caenorhabditis japonica TaxID=281687 RepID=A0A8R1HYB5_CAEJA